MIILLLNANNPFKASGIVALNLFNEFKLKGHDVKLLTNNYDINYPEGIVSMETYYQSLWKYSRLRNKFIYLKKKYNISQKINTDRRYEFFEFKEQKIFYRSKHILKKAGINPDVIIILFAKKFLNTKNIFELYKKTNAKIYWLMYDMAPLTGGCHYSWDCAGYQKKCGSCPGLFSADPSDITHKNILDKKYYIDKANIQLIAGSEWQYRQAKASSLFKDKPIHKILLSADPFIYKPVDKEAERLKIGIPANKKIIFFGSIALTTARKGMLYLLESLKILKERVKDSALDNDIMLLIAGTEINHIADDLPFEYLFMGLLDNTYGIASAYQIADIFICPSIEDSGPTMINQSIMCGTPVVSFEMGVSPDLVITGKTGYMAKLKDSKDLAQGIFEILSLTDDNFNEMSDNCRKLALKVCSPEVQIGSFENLFKN
ncbi:MAG: glycosyltransferase [Bacteroidales bacterium]